MSSIPVSQAVLLAHQRLADSAAALRAALTVDPGRPDLWNDLAMVLHGLGRADEAEAAFRQAITLRPGWPEAWNNLAINLHTRGRLDEAEAAYRQAVAAAPQFALAHYNSGRLFQDTGRMAEAEAAYRRAIELAPHHALAHYNLAMVLEEVMNFDEAEAMYRRAMALDPGLAVAANNLGTLLQGLGRVEEAETEYRRALSIQPDHCQAMNNLAAVLRSRGQIDEAVTLYEQALAIDPQYATALGNRISCELYRPGVTPETLADLHAEWDRRYAAPLRAGWKPHAVDRDPDRTLRLGFVSPDLGRHPVGYLLIAALEALDRRQAAVYCYSNRLKEDDLTGRFQTASDGWRRVRYWSDDRLADAIRDDRIDILFDLAGHTDGGRPLLVARKPAPLQAAWLGYASTTGLAAIDYLIADRWEVPEELEPFYRERILRMPDGYVCYWPSPEAPPVGPLPALSRGCVTFGSFNNPAKINQAVLSLWAEILRRVPQSRLVLAYGGISSPGQQDRIRNTLLAQRIAADRVELLSIGEHRALLAAYNRVDVALDTFPYNGGVTTCEALWMGVPVVAWPGRTFASRHSLSHLSNAGLSEWVAADAEGYVRLAVEAAGDLPRLAALRAGLRQRVAASPLCDAPRFAAAFQERIRWIWRRWIETA